ncbi:MAG: C39 family peptidase [Anaerolineaceae bacterium]|jgi:tetratricopeptide (TPR) repeat protein|nr:C39 family peptidase [Anaerolineaceae bacterium]MDD4043213.1 C39 family peptidase [Anaerolineaceae bacterium]MDD4577543.1 C39 family peptidase [Anaerolineaceae bacterium]
MEEKTHSENIEQPTKEVAHENQSQQNTPPVILKKSRRGWLIALAVLLVIAVTMVALYQLPSIQNRVYYHFTSFRSKVFYYFKPPAQSDFEVSAEEAMNADVAATLTAFAPTATLAPTITPTHAEAVVLPATPTATPAPTAIPAAVQLEGIVQEYQRFNSCGPATLALNLRYWGWVGEQYDIEKIVKPRIEDLNVTPKELLNYVLEYTGQDAILRYGGTVELLKELIAAGYPVFIERGYINRKDGWMGHYGVVDGYDDAQGAVHIPDTNNGYLWIPYDELQAFWDEFHGTYMVIFPPQDRDIVMGMLGADADEAYNIDTTLEKFRERSENVDRSEQYFAYYSLGELLVMKKDYVAAAEAFDNAFAVYNWLPIYDRPWRMLWYQVGPYEAYYYTGRYKTIISLTFKTVTDASTPSLPETFLWSGRANVALGNAEAAIWDFKRALEWHPGWEPAVAELAALGVTP